MKTAGGCHCGAIRYTLLGKPERHSVCHCADCRRSAGAPLVAWAIVATDRLTIEGEPVAYASSEHGRRHFCGVCGTGLFYTNDVIFDGLMDVQTATLDDPDAFTVECQVQTADRVRWIDGLAALPAYERYPPMD